VFQPTSYAPTFAQIRKIGAGSFGTAFLCHCKATGERVVIKKIDVRGMPAEERRIAQREATILAHLKHPAILHHIGTFEECDHLHIVTEYCESGDLSKLVENRRGQLLPESQIGDWFSQLCLALLYMHKRKVLHRDLKASEVCLGTTLICNTRDACE
jgi:NIMA (never in mitosis gene a)-related kinase 1/4/5